MCPLFSMRHLLNQKLQGLATVLHPYCREHSVYVAFIYGAAAEALNPNWTLNPELNSSTFKP